MLVNKSKVNLWYLPGSKNAPSIITKKSSLLRTTKLTRTVQLIGKVRRNCRGFVIMFQATVDYAIASSFTVNAQFGLVAEKLAHWTFCCRAC